jgi:hypothetical protein
LLDPAPRPFRGGGGAPVLFGVAYVAPTALLGAALAVPDRAPGLVALAGAAMIAGQVHAKAALLLGAGFLRPIALTRVRPGRRTS